MVVVAVAAAAAVMVEEATVEEEAMGEAEVTEGAAVGVVVVETE